jgi:hypothetical protein
MVDDDANFNGTVLVLVVFIVVGGFIELVRFFIVFPRAQMAMSASVL